MTNDVWVAEALTDDALVVELLIRLKQSSYGRGPSPANRTALLVWGHRQPRSRPAPKKEREPARYSPTTPLSWSGGASPSDGYDESSRPADPSSAGRSKGTFTYETNTASTSKRSRKRKTFAELKEDESLLLKERIQLKEELASLHVTLEEQRTRYDNLKRVKLDLHLQSANKTEATSDGQEEVISNQHDLIKVSNLDHVLLLPTNASQGNRSTRGSCKAQLNVDTQERCFILPDLNMTPSEEDSGFQTLCGVS